MAFVSADRVKETTTTTGTGTVTLAGAATGYQSFAAIGNGNTTYYTIAGQTGSEWEVGIGTYTSAGTTLSRTTVLASSNSGSLVTFSAGTKDVWCDYPAGRAVSSILQPILALSETATITAAAPSATTNFDLLTQPVQYYTTNASANFTLNVRGNSSTTFNSISSVGSSYTLVLLVTNGATPYYPTAYQIDGSAVTPKWQGGTAPSAGNASAVDSYTLTIVKTAATPTYVVLASQVKYA